jgi:DNA-binding NtrC family response regulator
MPVSKVSILVVEPCRDAREYLWELFRSLGYQVTLAEDAATASLALAVGRTGLWPDIAVVAQDAGDTSLLRELQDKTGFLDHVSVVMFPTFEAAPAADPRVAPVCRLKTLTNLLTVIRGLASKRHNERKPSRVSAELA